MRTALVTGADRGLGFSLAKELVCRGFFVYAGQYMPDWPFLAELKKERPDALCVVPLDVSDEKSVLRAKEEVARTCGVLDVLVNVAGISGRHGDSLGQAPDIENFERVVSVNAFGALRVTQAFLPLMEKGEKRLGFVSSEAGSIECCTRAGYMSYAVSKTALNMGVKLLFNELEPRGYRFRLYHPGWLRTWMSGEKSTAGEFEPEESAAVYADQLLEDRTWEDTLSIVDNKNAVWPF